MNNPANHPGIIHPLYPQTVEIPQPLDVHPSIPADLAEKLLGIVELFHSTPDAYDGHKSWLTRMSIYFGTKCNVDGCGCICAHLVGVHHGGSYAYELWPTKAKELRKIYSEAANNDTTPWAVERIETFLRTGE